MATMPGGSSISEKWTLAGRAWRTDTAGQGELDMGHQRWPGQLGELCGKGQLGPGFFTQSRTGGENRGAQVVRSVEAIHDRGNDWSGTEHCRIGAFPEAWLTSMKPAPLSPPSPLLRTDPGSGCEGTPAHSQLISPHSAPPQKASG